MKTAKSTLHIAEGGFLARPEKKADSDQRDAKIRPYAAQQPGFVETYGGPITGTDWGFFTAKFRSLEDMEHWQADRTHNDVQDEARDSFWYAYYVRKGRLLSAAETAEGKLLCEAVLLRDQPLSPEEHNVANAAAVETSRFGVLPYETLRGSPIPTPYVFTGPVGVLPQAAPVQYVLLTYWEKTEASAAWQESPAFQHFEQLGQVSTSLYVLIPERQPRMGLLPDRLQREWVAPDAPIDARRTPG